MPRRRSIKWLCPERDGGSQGGGNIVSNLFGGKQSIRVDIFVREDLQNRVDAKDPKQSNPVTVKMTFKELPKSLIRYYFPKAFQEHVQDSELRRLEGNRKSKRQKELQELFNKPKLPVLIIEDFNTIGLNGPVNTKFAEREKKSPYYHPDNALTCFFQRSGESGKTQKKLGSAGLGRHVYYMASKISSKLIYTIPMDSFLKTNKELKKIPSRALFFGQSCQNERQLRKNDKEICYENYLSLAPGKEDNDDKYSPYLPFGIDKSDCEIVEKVRQDFGLSRKKGQTGLSVIIPFPRNNLDPERIVDAIAKSFAIPILDGRLLVKKK